MSNGKWKWDDDVDDSTNIKSAFKSIVIRMDIIESKLDDTLDCLFDNANKESLIENKAKEFYNNGDFDDMMSSLSSMMSTGSNPVGFNDLASSLKELKGRLSSLNDNLSSEILKHSQESQGD
jgi:hypothetical protein